MVNTKKSLIFSALSLILCCALLIGTTFAWFTDSVTNTGNKIQAGNLKVDLVQLGATLNDGQREEIGGTIGQDTYYSLKNVKAPVFDYELWEPGYTVCKVIGVKNTGNLALKFDLDIVPNGELGALADVIDIYGYAPAQAPTTGSLAEAFDGFDSFSDVLEHQGYVTTDFLYLGTLADRIEQGLLVGELNNAQSTVYWVFVFHMREDAGNEYQGMSIGDTFDIVLNAAQNTVEEDGFGSDQYDKDATYPVASAAEMKEALANGGIVSVNKDIKTDNIVDNIAARITISKPTTLNLDAKIISPDDMGYNKINFCALIVDADTTINAGENGGIDTGENGGYALNVREGANLTITGGSYYGGGTAVQVQEGTLTITGGHFAVEAFGEPYGYNFLLNCIDTAYKNGSAKIIVKGGTFVNFNPADNQAEGPGTNFVAEGYKVISEDQTNGDVWYTVVPE